MKYKNSSHHLNRARLFTLFVCSALFCVTNVPCYAHDEQITQPNTQHTHTHSAETKPEPAPAPKLILEVAKERGLVGETPSGLISAVQKPPYSPELEALIRNTNKGRMIAYKKAANKKGLPLTYVQAKAGRRLMALTGPGHYYYDKGRWNLR